MIRKWLSVFLALVLLLPAALAEGTAGKERETGLEYFKVRHGSRECRKIAITMDDANERQWVWKAVELCREYGIAMTFFPSGSSLKDADREGWLDVIDAGCEIASHGNDHKSMKEQSAWAVLYKLGIFQQKLDSMLQVHYPVRWFRPPYGDIADSSGNENPHTRTIRMYGYDHVLLWDVSETNARKAAEKVQNGSILLYHARKKDYECLAELIPMLLDAGYEPVTVSELFGYPLPETGGELYTFDKELYLQK